MTITVTFSFDEKTVKQLGEIAGNGHKSEKLRELISHEWKRIFNDGEGAHAPTISAETTLRARPETA